LAKEDYISIRALMMMRLIPSLTAIIAISKMLYANGAGGLRASSAGAYHMSGIESNELELSDDDYINFISEQTKAGYMTRERWEKTLLDSEKVIDEDDDGGFFLVDDDQYRNHETGEYMIIPSDNSNHSRGFIRGFFQITSQN
jgi:hypothetical protein